MCTYFFERAIFVFWNGHFRVLKIIYTHLIFQKLCFRLKISCNLWKLSLQFQNGHFSKTKMAILWKWLHGHRFCKQWVIQHYLPIIWHPWQPWVTDKETDESWDIFMIWKINSGLVWATGQYCEKKFGADYEQLLRPVFYVFMGKK